MATRAVPFLLIPVLTRHLTPSEMGVAAMFVLAINLAAPLVGFSTEAAIARRYVDRDALDYPAYIGNCFLILAATAALVGAVSIILREPLGAALAVPPSWIWVAVLAAAARYTINVRLNVWQMQHRPASFAGLSFTQTVAALALSVYLVVALDWGWEGRVVGEVVSLLALAAMASVLLRRDRLVRFSPDAGLLRDAARYGGGLVPHQYGGLLIAAMDRMFITNMVGVEETGLYVVGVQIAMIVGVIEHSFNQAWVPWYFGVMASGDRLREERAKLIARIYKVSLLVFALALSAVAPWFLGFFVGSEYREASQFVIWLALAGAFSGMYKMPAARLYYANRTHWLAGATFATGCANLALNYFLIRRNGAVGAAQATAAAMLTSYLLTSALASRVRRPVNGRSDRTGAATQ
jgi:O-antigen/teichoic acid export membrane protein